MTVGARRRLRRWCGSGLLGMGAYAVVHPEVEAGESLVLLGLAVMEAGSARVRRGLREVTALIDGVRGRWRRA